MNIFTGKRDLRLAALERHVALLESQISALTVCYDKFFDVVAADLGLEAKEELRWPASSIIFGLAPVSPRDLAERITPERREVVRIKGKKS